MLTNLSAIKHFISNLGFKVQNTGNIFGKILLICFNQLKVYCHLKTVY